MLKCQFIKKVSWQYPNEKIYYHPRGIFRKTVMKQTGLQTTVKK